MQWYTLFLPEASAMINLRTNDNYGPDDLKKTELEAVAAFCSDAEVGEHEEAGVGVLVFAVLEVIKGRHDRAGGAARLAILE